jgi:hypothetical protein
MHKYARSDDAAFDAYLASEYATYRWWRCHAHLGDVVSRIIKFDYLYHSGQMNVFSKADGYPNALRVGGADVKATTMPGPALELDDQQTAVGMRVFDRALAFLRARFPRAAITVVFVPSPLSIYRHAQAEAQALFMSPVGYTSRRFPAEQVAARSEQICTLVRAEAERAHLGFINAAPALRDAASAHSIHGPIDWSHFNKEGYQVFGEAIARRLADSAAVDRCG